MNLRVAYACFLLAELEGERIRVHDGVPALCGASWSATRRRIIEGMTPPDVLPIRKGGP